MEKAEISEGLEDRGHASSCEITQNDARTCEESGAELAQPGSRDVLTKTYRDLMAVRNKYGAETPPGYRCSNTAELLQTPSCPAHMFEYRTEYGVQYFRNRRTDNIELQTRDLQRLLQAVQ